MEFCVVEFLVLSIVWKSFRRLNLIHIIVNNGTTSQRHFPNKLYAKTLKIESSSNFLISFFLQDSLLFNFDCKWSFVSLQDIFPDKATKRNILSYHVKCPSKECEWTGEARYVEVLIIIIIIINSNLYTGSSLHKEWYSVRPCKTIEK